MKNKQRNLTSVRVALNKEKRRLTEEKSSLRDNMSVLNDVYLYSLKEGLTEDIEFYEERMRKMSFKIKNISKDLDKLEDMIMIMNA